MWWISLIIAALFSCLAKSAPSADAAAPAAWRVTSHCDAPGPYLKSLMAGTVDDCQRECERLPGCKAIVHVSGWGRCHLAAAQGRTARITFKSSAMTSGGRTLAPPQVDHDHSGKDLRKADEGSWEACAKTCEADVACVAVTYIEGYRACWLKKTEGRFSGKIFTCAVRAG